MSNERREAELKKTARSRGFARNGDEEAEAMREVESMNDVTPAQVDPASLTEIKQATDPKTAIPPNAPDSVKRAMSARMDRFKLEIERRVPGETRGARTTRLDKLRTELWPDAGCDCNGTGLIIKRGSLRNRWGRDIPNSTWATVCECPHGQARRGQEAGSREDGDPQTDHGLGDVF